VLQVLGKVEVKVTQLGRRRVHAAGDGVGGEGAVESEVRIRSVWGNAGCAGAKTVAMTRRRRRTEQVLLIEVSTPKR
jgi:hypothetical protein